MNVDVYDTAIGDLQKFLSPHSKGVIEPDTDLLEEGIVDSLLMMDLIGHLEGTYRIRLGVEDLVPSQFRSVSALASLIARRLQPEERASRVA